MGLGSVVSKGAKIVTGSLGKAKSGIVAGSEKLLGNGKATKVLGKTGKGLAKAGGVAGSVALSGAKGVAGLTGSAVNSIGGGNLLKLGGAAGIVALLSNDKIIKALSESLTNMGEGIKKLGDNAEQKLKSSEKQQANGSTPTISSELKDQSGKIKQVDEVITPDMPGFNGGSSKSKDDQKGSTSGVPGVPSLGHQQYATTLESNTQNVLAKQNQLDMVKDQETSQATTDKELTM